MLGARKVTAVTRDDIENLLHDIAAGKTAVRRKRGIANDPSLQRREARQPSATRTTSLLGAIFTYAVRKYMRPDNPVHGVTLFAVKRRERRLSDAEYADLSLALAEAEAKRIWPPAINAARFLALTGWRRGEVLGLTWSEIDLERRTAILADTKAGRSVRPLSNAACDLLRAQSRIDALVFPATRGKWTHEWVSEVLDGNRGTRQPSYRRDAACPAAFVRVCGRGPWI